MPHDINGKVLNVNDVVLVKCIITNVHLGDEYCNLNLATVENMYPSDKPSSLVLNAKQVEKLT